MPAPTATFDLELEQIAAGRRVVVGLDEAGRGPWAGPLVVGACAVTADLIADAPAGLADSKTLTARRRAELAAVIPSWAPVEIGWVTAAEIDTHGMAACLRLACQRAVDKLAERGIHADIYLQDGSASWIPAALDAPRIIRAKLDLTAASVAAASIVAKHQRDQHMHHLAGLFPTHPALGASAGYGTAAHIQQIRDHGLTPVHRRSWAYVAKIRPDLAP